MKKIFILSIVITLFCSCSKFLEPKSQSEYSPKTADALNEMLLGEAYPSRSGSAKMFCYHNILDDDVRIVDSLLFISDLNDATQGIAYRSLFSWSIDMYQYKKTSNNVWASYYRKILGANSALDYIDRVSGTIEQKAYVSGQAYALRAFYYFNLINLFGEPYNYNKQALGVPLKLTSAFVGIYPTRNTVEEVYEQIVSDLVNAETEYLKLPADMQFRKNYRVSLPMVQLLRARVHLYMDEMETAATYANKVIKDWSFSLYNLTTFTATASVPYPQFVSFDNPEVIWAYGAPGDVFSFANTYGKTSDAIDNSDNRKLFNASTELLNCYGTGDFRKDLYMVTEVKNNAKRKNKAICGKTVITSTYGYDENAFGASFRLSEAYLIRAEAIAKTAPTEALSLINDIRKRRIKEANYTDIENISGTQLLDSIYVERRRELCFEGHRWFDLRRQGMNSFSREWLENTSNGEFRKTYTIEKNDPAYTLPLMPEVIKENPNLKQNTLANPK